MTRYGIIYIDIYIAVRPTVCSLSLSFIRSLFSIILPFHPFPSIFTSSLLSNLLIYFLLRFFLLYYFNLFLYFPHYFLLPFVLTFLASTISSSFLSSLLLFILPIPFINPSFFIVFPSFLNSLTVSRQVPTTEVRVSSQVNSYGIYAGQSGTETNFLRTLWFSLPILISPTAPYSIIIV